MIANPGNGDGLRQSKQSQYPPFHPNHRVLHLYDQTAAVPGEWAIVRPAFAAKKSEWYVVQILDDDATNAADTAERTTVHCQYFNTRGKGALSSRRWLPVWLNQVTGKEHWQKRRPKNCEPFDTLVQHEWFVADSFRLDGHGRIPAEALRTAAATGRVAFAKKIE